MRSHRSVVAALVAGVFVLSGSLLSAANIRMAIVPLDPSLVNEADLLTAEFSTAPNLALLERAEIEKVRRELNLAAARPATVVVAGQAAWTIAAIEIGASVTEPTFVLSRQAAEDVFRTVATEPRDRRRRNPGLPVDQVDSICASCCAMVAIIRSLHLEEVTVQP